MVNKVINLLQTARNKGIFISVDKGELQVRFSKGNHIDPSLIQEIKDNKQLIIEFLSNDQWKSKNVESFESDLKPVDRNAIQNIPLSFSQERLWFINQLEGTVQYHLPAILRFKGNLNTAALEHALQHIVDRHEVLRTVLQEKDGEVYQYTMDKQHWKLSIIDGSIYKGNLNQLQDYIKIQVAHPFDLSKDYMLRASLVTIDPQEHLLIVTMHHIASDGWSLSIIVKEVAELYSAYVEARPVRLIPLKIQYADFAFWQRKYFTGSVLEKKINYWKEKLQGVSILQLPTDYNRPAVQSTQGANITFNLDKEVSANLQLLAQSCGATLFMTLLAAFKVLLYRYSGQKDICVGTPTAGRQQTEVEDLVGFFVNTLALRTEVDGASSFVDFLQTVKTTTMEAYDHQEVSFEKVVEVVVKQRDMSRSPLFQVMFVLQNLPDTPKLHLNDLILTGESLENNTAKFDLSFFLNETPQGLVGFVEYCTDLYKESTVGRMLEHFKELLASIVQTPQQKIGQLPLLNRREEQQLLKSFNDTAMGFPAGKNIIDLFEEQVAKTPTAIAIVFEDARMSYQELNDRANQLAHYLSGKGIKANALVPVCIQRGIDMLIGILGILKSGGAYVPIDPEYPAERIGYMIDDTRAALVVSSSAARLKLPFIERVEIIELDGDRALIGKEPSSNLSVAVPEDQLAYIIYTSGSTGRPKGVMIEHRNVYSFICWCVREFSLSDFEVVYASTSMCFDLSVFEFFFPLATGKRIRIMESGLDISKYLSADKKVMLNSVPVVVENLLREGTPLDNVTVINMAGEPIPLYVQQGLNNSGIELRNLYGPTEDTTYSTVYRIQTGKPVLIGKPIANTTIYILNAEHALAPMGVPGEIFIAGAGLARGYLNREDLTAERFIANPFEARSRMYRTGDLGRWLPDGNIDYLGRLDDQVKIRGYRIELGEIETILQQSGLVTQSVVMATADKTGSKQLVGYAVATEQGFDKEAVIEYLTGRLPGYMVPFTWIELKSLPLTPNGKIDKKALPAPEMDLAKIIHYEAPRNKVETELAAIWQRLLNIEKAGIHNNFFELGGHSLLAMRLISAIRREMNVELAIKDLFVNPTIAALAQHLQSQNNEAVMPSIEIVQPRPANIPLSFSQERLWFVDRLAGSIQYHLPAVLRFKGILNKEALLYTLQQIVNRHEVLRTVLREVEGKVYQFVTDTDKWNITEEDASIYIDDDLRLQHYIKQLISAPCDLSKDSMLRANLVTMGAQNHLLVVTMHHIASDAWSTSILVKEVVSLYNSYNEGTAAELPTLEIQYADYAIWQQKYLQGEILDKKIAYWKDKLKDVSPLQLPADRLRPAIQSTRGAVTGFTIDEDLANALKVLSQQQGSTLFMTLLAAFKVLLYRYSGQQDICVGTSVANRNQQETEALIGFFVNMLALRSELNKEESFLQLLRQVKANTMQAYQHQEAPFEKVVEAVVKERDLGRNPLVQVMLVLLNTPDIPALRLGELSLEPYSYEHTTTQFDITILIAEISNGLQGS
ncbi:MAG: amino acid adenylation domain-containing protein, partial [Ferruginibacter sp.]